MTPALLVLEMVEAAWEGLGALPETAGQVLRTGNIDTETFYVEFVGNRRYKFTAVEVDSNGDEV